MDGAVFLFWRLSSCFLHRTRCPPESVPSCEISSCSSCTTLSTAAPPHALLRFICTPAPPTAASLPKDPAGRGLSFLGVGLSQFLCSTLVGSDWFGSTRLFPLSSSDLFNTHVHSDAFGAEFQMIHTALGSCALTSFTWGVPDSGWSSRFG